MGSCLCAWLRIRHRQPPPVSVAAVEASAEKTVNDRARAEWITYYVACGELERAVEIGWDGISPPPGDDGRAAHEAALAAQAAEEARAAQAAQAVHAAAAAKAAYEAAMEAANASRHAACDAHASADASRAALERASASGGWSPEELASLPRSQRLALLPPLPPLPPSHPGFADVAGARPQQLPSDPASDRPPSLWT
jgi:hypothetical protein